MDVVSLLTVAVGLVLIYLGVHGDKTLLPTHPPAYYKDKYDAPGKTGTHQE